MGIVVAYKSTVYSIMGIMLQMDGAPGHITSIICRIAAETGRKIIWTPPGTSGYVQPADDIINASFQSGFMKVCITLLLC